MNCLICGNNNTVILFEAAVMFKLKVRYYQCGNCASIQTEKPYWLDEAYKKAITAADIGLLARNIDLSNSVFDLVVNNFDCSKRFLDFGGGYGVMVRLLRDRGLDFYRQDIYCENLFAINHDIADLIEQARQFELVTCFEVFEHVHDPHKLFEELQKYAPNILISTQLLPTKEFKSAADWWYFAPEMGQHVTFYTLRSLEIIARQYNMHLYSNGQNLHLFTSGELVKNPLEIRNNLMDKIIHKIKQFFSNPNKKTLVSLTENDMKIVMAKAFDLNS